MYKDEFSIVKIVHNILAERISSGAKVIDATAGQGNDTLFLGKLVGATGFVWAFDIQEKACQITKEKLLQEKINWVQVICDNHANLGKYVKEEVQAAIFNLGYLPGQEHQIKTTGDTTIKAMQDIMHILSEKGILILVCYLGHVGGMDEYQQIYHYLQSLSAKTWCVSEFSFVNKEKAPRVLIVSK